MTVDICRNEANKRCAYVSGTKTLCGSITTVDECVRNLIEATGCDVVEALRSASEHAAKMLRLYPRKGSLEFGADADFVLLSNDADLKVLATFIAGDLVWSTSNWTPKFKHKFNQDK